jgi:hypothetical protein
VRRIKNNAMSERARLAGVFAVQQASERRCCAVCGNFVMLYFLRRGNKRRTPLRFPKEVIRHGSLFADEVMENGMNAVVVEVPFDISSDKGVLADGLRIGNDDDGNRPCLVEIRQGF